MANKKKISQDKPNNESEPQEPQEPPTTENPTNQDDGNTKKTINKNSDVYSLPLLNSIKVGTVSTNNEIKVISVTGKWVYIQNDSISGWVYKSNINGIE